MDYPDFYPDFVESTGYGTGPGLCGWNCRHNFNAYIDGMARTYTDEQVEEMNASEQEKKSFGGKEYNAYEATQRQRALERSIRAKREKVSLLREGGADASSIDEAGANYQKTADEYARFSKAMGLPQQMQRTLLGAKKRK